VLFTACLCQTTLKQQSNYKQAPTNITRQNATTNNIPNITAAMDPALKAKLEESADDATNDFSSSSRSPHRHAAIPVFAVRHGQSVANVKKKADRQAYYKIAWLDDSDAPPTTRLRDCALTEEGVRETLRRSMAEPLHPAVHAVRADNDSTASVPSPSSGVLLVVSPLLRTVLTASLLFRRLVLDKSVRLHVALEPAAAEVLNAPHDIIENIGRDMKQVFAEARSVLAEHTDLTGKTFAAEGAGASADGADEAKVSEPSSDGALALLEMLEEAARLPPLWWFAPAAPGQLPKRVLETGAEARLQRLREAVAAHVDDIVTAAAASSTEEVPQRSIDSVFIVCHWGVMFTLTGEKGAKNLDCESLPKFWGE
jgi:hypothetical protein